MPHLDGFGLCAQLKDHPATRGIPVIILSSLDTDRDVEQGFNVGAAAYVSKAEAQTQLNETIERVLEKNKFHRSRLVLVVDDSPNIRQRVTQALEEAGFQVMEAEDGKQALKRIAERRPDLILSDLDMPQMNGTRALPKTSRGPRSGDHSFCSHERQQRSGHYAATAAMGRGGLSGQAL